MNKLVIGVIIAFLAGCTQSEEYYLSNIEEAKEAMKECYANQKKGIRLDSSDDCLNAFNAINKNKVAKAKAKRLLEKEQRLAKKRQKEEAMKAEMLKFTDQYQQSTGSKLYKAHKRRECESRIQCKALKEILTLKIKESIELLDEQIGSERAKLVSSGKLYKKACFGITKDDYKCSVIGELDNQLLSAAKIKHQEMIRFYLDNRDKIQPAYSECHKTIKDIMTAGINHVHTTWVYEASVNYVPDNVYIKCHSVRKALSELGVSTHAQGFKITPDEINKKLN